MRTTSSSRRSGRRTSSDRRDQELAALHLALVLASAVVHLSSFTWEHRPSFARDGYAAAQWLRLRLRHLAKDSAAIRESMAILDIERNSRTSNPAKSAITERGIRCKSSAMNQIHPRRGTPYPLPQKNSPYIRLNPHPKSEIAVCIYTGMDDSHSRMDL